MLSEDDVEGFVEGRHGVIDVEMVGAGGAVWVVPTSGQSVSDGACHIGGQTVANDQNLFLDQVASTLQLAHGAIEEPGIRLRDADLARNDHHVEIPAEIEVVEPGALNFGVAVGDQPQGASSMQSIEYLAGAGNKPPCRPRPAR